MWFAGALIVLVGCRFEPGSLPGVRDDAAQIDARLVDMSTTDGTMGDDAMVDATSAKPCPATYTLTDSRWPNSRYRSITASMDWAQAEMNCEADGGGSFLPTHLVVLDDTDERTFVYSQGTTDKWIGVTDTVNDNTLVAVTDQASPHFGAASSNQQSKDCMFTNQTQTVMEVCTAGFPSLCECDGLAADPTNF